MTEAVDSASLLEENRKLKEALAASAKLGRRAIATYQQQALQMEIIRQQNEDLDRLAADLSKAKQIAEQKARESESAAQLQGEFLANFSHEIRTPLNGILGYCDLLLREEGDRLTPHGRRDLNIVKANARTLLSLINDILDLSKIESGHMDVIREQAELRPLVEQCVGTVRQMLRGKEVELVVNLDARAERVFTDVLKLRQILLNLLSNAVKFTDAGEVVLSIGVNGNALTLQVEDTGIGIAADKLEQIFDKFRQADGSSTRRAGGTGLGLAIVRQLCKLLGGSIQVESVHGRGSKFSVVLPHAVPEMAAQASEPQAASVEPLRATRRATVLVVDDDTVLQRLLRTELEAAGFRVVSAGNGAEALVVARECRPDTIILDIHLPAIDGWSVLTQLKSDPILSQIHVVIVSVEDDRSRGYSMGACDYLVKPVEVDQLVSIVKRSVTPASGEVLVVDDDAATRELVSRSLKRVGFTVSQAASGEDALLRIRHSAPAMLVLDLLMPGVDGFDVLLQLRAEGRSVPVVVLTGKTLSAEEESVLRSGFAQIVVKGGFAIDQIVCEAKRALVQRRDVEAKRNAKVLYIEDSAQNRDIVRRYLHGKYDVYEAEDGMQGLELAASIKPDLILMDLSLPRLDGWQTTRELKKRPELSGIPVVALSAHVTQEDMTRAFEAGCTAYLTKPLGYEELLAALHKQLSSAVRTE